MKRVDYFDCIDTKEKAYILGFIAGDGHIGNDEIEISVKLMDNEITQFISNQIGSTYKESKIFNKQKRIFPSSSTFVYSKHIATKLKMMFGGRLKNERSLPRIKKELEPYMVLGFFDADGCITWGYRKDRNRLWQKISFTSQPNLLISLQNILYKEDITSIIRPKSNEDCSVIEFSNELDIFKFMKYLPNDSFFLRRKYNTYLSWLNATIEKYQFNKNDIVSCVDIRTLVKYKQLVPENYKTFKNVEIINIVNDIAFLKNDIKIDVKYLSKSGISNYALRLELEEFGKKHRLM